MKLLFYMLLFVFGNLSAQQIESGKVTDPAGKPMSETKIYLEVSYDGITSTSDGSFCIETSSKGHKMLVIRHVSYVPFRREMLVSEMQNLEIFLRKDVQALDVVVLNTGSLVAMS